MVQVQISIIVLEVLVGLVMQTFFD